jgi:hypothetical protein
MRKRVEVGVSAACQNEMLFRYSHSRFPEPQSVRCLPV